MTRKITEDERQIFIRMQLDNVCKLLGDGELQHKTIVNSRSEVKHQYTITYTEKK